VENTFGQIKDSMRVSGLPIRCMEMGSSLGLMVSPMKVEFIYNGRRICGR